MPKHAMPRARRLNQLKVIATAVLVVAFVTLFVGGATGLIGSPGSDDSARSVSADDPGEAASEDQEAGSEGSENTGASASPSPPASSVLPSVEPTPVVTDVPPQEVKGAKKLKRSLDWLRRGLADETTFRVGTFNVLGDSHTRPGGNKRGWASGYTRMGWAWSAIVQAGVSVVGFQELEDVQYNRLRDLSGWEAYPGPTLDRGSIRNSLGWDPDVWELVEANSIGIPYFGGQIIRRPVVKLRNIASDREVWFFNTHNPASTPRWGNNARWRAAAISIQVDLANELAADGTPVVFTGDFNDRAEAYCPLTGSTTLEAANGGSNDGSCSPPGRMDVDWVFGSGVEWTGFVSATQGITGRVTDHPFVYAEAYVPEEPLSDAAAAAAGIDPSSGASETESADE